MDEGGKNSNNLTRREVEEKPIGVGIECSEKLKNEKFLRA